MKRIHFIAIGGAAMHNLALALSEEANCQVSGSDDEIFEPSRSRLQAKGLLPEKTGWFPDERIHQDLDCVIVGMHATADNPELLRAQALGLTIYSFPEYLYQHSKDKLRIVIGGSHGKTTTTAMILHILKKLGYESDYMVGAQITGFENMVRLSNTAKLAVFEGDEYLTSPIDPRPKFHLYHPHIAVLTGVAWDHINVFPSYENYVEQFHRFAELIEANGKLIYFEGDPELRKIASELRPDIQQWAYTTPPHHLREGKTYLQTPNGEICLSFFGRHNLQNMEAAHLVCRQLGISDKDFYAAISDFSGAARRLQKIAETDHAIAFKDFAHAPSKLRASIEAVREQYPQHRLIACMELHSFSSLTKDFLPQYKGCMQNADSALIYYNPEVIRHKGLAEIEPGTVRTAFGGDNLRVFTDSKQLCDALKQLDYQKAVLLIMTSGNFSGIDIDRLGRDLIGVTEA